MANIVIGEIEEIDILKKRGDTKRISMTLTESDKLTPIDVTNDSFVFSVTSDSLPTDALTLLFASSAVIVDGPNGKISFPLTAGDANNLGVFFYDVSRIEPNGDISTILEGSYTLSQDRGK